MKYSNETKTILLQLGINRNYKGYDYIVYAVSSLIQDPNYKDYITKFLYPDIAKYYHTSWRCVERDIRTVINLIWKTENSTLLAEICGGKLIEKPKNKDFLILVANYVTLIANNEIAITNSSESIQSNICPTYKTICSQLMFLNNIIRELKNEKSELEKKNDTLLYLLIYFIQNKK